MTLFLREWYCIVVNKNQLVIGLCLNISVTSVMFADESLGLIESVAIQKWKCM